jgi:hypothetical protein
MGAPNEIIAGIYAIDDCCDSPESWGIFTGTQFGLAWPYMLIGTFKTKEDAMKFVAENRPALDAKFMTNDVRKWLEQNEEE